MHISRGGGGQGIRPLPPEKSQKYRVSWQYWSESPEKSQSYQARIQCWAIIGTPAKHHLKWYLDPLSPHKLKNIKRCHSRTPSDKTFLIHACILYISEKISLSLLSVNS